MDPLNDSETFHQDLSVYGGAGVKFDDGRKGDWMQTYTGKRFYPADPRVEDVDILDIALALGNVSRYLGHCRFYSVAEHSILVSKIVPPHLALEGLLHDAEEAYSHDFIRPWKRALDKDNQYFKLAKQISIAVRRRFMLPDEETPAVKEADVAILGVEKDVLHPRSDPWYLPYPKPDVKIFCLDPQAATLAFLRRFAVLYPAVWGPGLLMRANKIFGEDEVRLHEHWSS